MGTRGLRFGIGLLGLGPVAELAEQGRRAQDIGFDVVLLPDHLGMTAPLVPLVAIAAAAPSVRVGNLVLDAAFYRPALLARDLAAVDSATGGRLEINLGTGYVAEEFTAAGLPFPGPGRRVDILTEHVTELRRLLSSPDHVPAPVQAPPPIMVAGMGDRVLAMAARHADTVAVATLGDDAHLVERVAYVREQAGERAADVELAFSFFQTSIDDPDDVSILQRLAPYGRPIDHRKQATLLTGPIEAAVERIHALHEQLGITYFTFNLTPSVSWESLEKILAAFT